MEAYIAEFIGTLMLVLIGDGVCANASLEQTKGHRGANWLQINVGWALAVFVGVICAQKVSGAHLNPAVTIGLAAAQEFPWSQAVPYLVAQFAGAFVGAGLVFLFYVQHFSVTSDANAKLGSFCTGPAIRDLKHNFLSEVVGTFVLLYAVFMSIGDSPTLNGQPLGLGQLGALPVALVVFAIGIGLGGTSGYAINPARDFSPRLAHALLPIPNKRDSDWSYAWVPFCGPLVGALLAAALFLLTTPTVPSS